MQRAGLGRRRLRLLGLEVGVGEERRWVRGGGGEGG